MMFAIHLQIKQIEKKKNGKRRYNSHMRYLNILAAIFSRFYSTF